jgi:polysaccharide deacetylase 2 family uncharacterized protein YibQ
LISTGLIYDLILNHIGDLSMTTEKRKGSGKKRKLSSILFLFILPTALACAVLLGVYVCLPKSSIGLPRLAYEEIYTTTNDLHEGIRDIDYAIYESLYQSGIEEKDIFFSNVQPRHENGHFWDFTGLLIKCPDARSALHLEKTISQDLNALGAKIRIKNEKSPDGGIVCHVFADGFYTHKIDITFETQRPMIDDTRPRLALIIDDLGYDSKLASSFIELDLPLSFSVLPSAPFTKRIVTKANKDKCELILHLPMEPKNFPSVDPGPGALFLSMDEDEIRQILDQDLKEVKGVQGVNNHMGSSFTEDQDKMLIILKDLKKRGLFFVDSRTTARSVGFSLAKKIGLPTASRSVFLDNDLSHKAIRIQIERLLNIARNSGAAIGIGHPHKETLEVLDEYCSKIKTEFCVVPVSELVS